MRRPNLQALEWARYLADRLLIVPAADLLPRGAALRVADLVGATEARIPSRGARLARAEVHAALGVTGADERRAAARRLAGMRRDLAVNRRLSRGREHPRDWRLVQEGAAPVEAMLAERRPFLVATGHFYYSADLVLPDVIMPRLAGHSLGSAPPDFRLEPGVLRQRFENGISYGLPTKLLGLPHYELPYAGSRETIPTILEALARPGGVVRIYIDAMWEKPRAHRRPFAGLAERGFALGTARIARLAQCPVVLGVAVWDDDSSVRVVWRPPIDPPPIDDEQADVRVIDQLLDDLEALVGRFPLQYLHPLGADRRWDAAALRWDPPRGAASLAEAAPRV